MPGFVVAAAAAGVSICYQLFYCMLLGECCCCCCGCHLTPQSEARWCNRCWFFLLILQWLLLLYSLVCCFVVFGYVVLVNFLMLEFT